MGWVEKRLAALGYPSGIAFDINNMSHVQTLVAWLEDTKIRFYKIEERETLRVMDDKWIVAFQQYLGQLGCPHKIKEDMTATERVVIIDWLLSHAIGLVYRDNAEEINQQSKKHLDSKQATTTPVDVSDYSSAQFKASLRSLSELLQIPHHDDPDILLNTIKKTVQTKFSTIMLTAQDPNQSSALHSDTSITEDKFPLGFNTGEKQTDKASTILRLLYIKDLRELQTDINDLIVAVQSFTSNPRTNTMLGKVGR